MISHAKGDENFLAKGWEGETMDMISHTTDDENFLEKG